MTRRTLTYALLATGLGLATAITASNAFAGNGIGGFAKNPMPVHMQIKDVTLAIKSPDACPGQAKLAVFFRANKKGSINFLLVRKNGMVTGPFTVQTKKYGNEYRAAYIKTFNVLADVNAQYRAIVTHSGKKGSRWVPLQTKC